MNLNTQLKELHQQERKLLQMIDEKNKRKMIPCVCCNKKHSIYKLTAIQLYHYVEPHGCMEGGYWTKGELQFICPSTQIRNRIMFDHEFDYTRMSSINEAEEEFKRKFKELFKEVVRKNHEGIYGQQDTFVNNYYIDQNRSKFGLREKEKK